MAPKMKRALKILLIIFWIGSGINHFRIPDFYLNLMPGYIPWHETMIYLSGMTEIAAGIMVAIPKTRRYGVWFIQAHLLIFMTVHVHMIQNAASLYPEIPLIGLWIRLPIQALFATWAWWSTTADATPDEASVES